MGIRVRAAGPGDGDALVGLRIANAERHVELDPGLYRLPDVEAVRRHFDALLSGGSESLVLVAEAGTRVVGMAELVPLALPPDHQILIPRPAAEIHTVVLDGHRAEGVGAALVAAIDRPPWLSAPTRRQPQIRHSPAPLRGPTPVVKCRSAAAERAHAAAAAN